MPSSTRLAAIIGLLLLTVLAARNVLVPFHGWAQDGRINPEAATGVERKTLATAQRFMVSAANPYAVRAGVDTLKRGGSAVDAAIAVQMVLNLVEPQSSGIGGGAFLLNYDQSSGDVVSFDGRETSPARARPNRFLGEDGKRLPFREAVRSGLSVGVPGLIAMLADAHSVNGKLPWADLFEPAIRLSEAGFKVSRRMHLSLLFVGEAHFSNAARAYFFPGGRAVPIGTVLRNPEFATTLKLIANSGPRAFYAGPVAEAIVDAVSAARPSLSDLTLSDLANYQPERRAPVCTFYRSHRVCGMGPPSSGGYTVAQTLKLIEPFELGGARAVSDLGRLSDMHLVAEAQKLSYADRNRYLADPAFIAIPGGLLDDAYLTTRRGLISRGKAMTGRPKAGTPPGVKTDRGVDGTEGRPGTSHISIVDEAGNAVSMTTTIEGAFGSGLWAAGFLLNNELTDFSFRPKDAQGRPIANAVEGGKRPRSSMSPTLVFDPDGGLKAVLGSPGGSRIILYVTKALVGLIDWKLNAQEVTEVLNFGSRGRGFELEMGQATPGLALRLEQMGHDVRPDFMVSGLHVIVRRDGRLEGGADPRREGIALGE
ncbi:MAG: gamma-glutamyltransferase [Pseudomonadota bacterium]